MPEDLKAVRDHIAGNIRKFRSIIEGKAFRKMFGQLSGDQLSRVPRGYAVDHPAAEYLKYRQYLAGRNLDSGIATQNSFYKTILETFRTMMPLIRFLNEPVVRNQRVRDRQDSVLS